MLKENLNKKGYSLNFVDRLSLNLNAGSNFMSAINTFSQGVSNKQSYVFQAWQNNTNANLLRADARDILNQSYDYENKIRREGEQTVGRQVAAMSASGFDVSSGSYQSIIGETNRNIENNIAAIRYEAMTKYAAAQAQADMADIQASYYRKAGRIEKRRSTVTAGLESLTGALKLGASNYFKNAVVDVTDTAKNTRNTIFKDEYYKG